MHTSVESEKLLPILQPTRKDALGISTEILYVTTPSLICLASLLCRNLATNQPDHGSHKVRFRCESHPLGTAKSYTGLSQ